MSTQLALQRAARQTLHIVHVVVMIYDESPSDPQHIPMAGRFIAGVEADSARSFDAYGAVP